MGVESIVVAGRDAWLKAYDQGDNRRLALGLLDAVARRLDIDALRIVGDGPGETHVRRWLDRERAPEA